ncbi:glycosyltransferase family 2 protein [Salipiger aestuarii]|uniref:Glycosyltransferase involved in cell wall biosynthesis n=1 Tax=Salipiger aestuarii TaxID=568098 RepID=A0A327XKQ7_9RHOB|nr:glycosyltransferase [Salipiger aestuarii]EIE48950.1 glycosyltransferase/CDP-glycerol:poly(glycerophosphate) glycerophosphotransferase [Citreicella sp. 357]RAK09293.1 glycosyltransferase involved in cell wall biosynthesis [Salipiger aestuarii]
MSPRISVIVPIYNVADYVTDCIRSILDQSFGDFELIAVDDGSLDGSGEIAERAAAGDLRFRLIRQANAGLSGARNTGLNVAHGQTIAFVDSDDTVAPDYLERLERTLRDTGADWVACGILFHGPDSEMRHSARHDAPRLLEDQPDLPLPQTYPLTDWRDVVCHFPSAWNKLYRRALIEGIRFDEGLNYEDHAFFHRCAARTDRLVHLHAPLYRCRQGRPGQITRDGSDRIFEQFDVLDILRGITAGPEKPGGAQAMAQLTTRLTFERIEAIADRPRRARFLDGARAAQAATGLPPDDRLGVPAWWMDLLNGAVPVSVVIPSNGDDAALRQSLEPLAAQTLPEAQILVVADSPAAHAALAGLDLSGLCPGAALMQGPGGADMHARVAGARNAGLDAARGRAVVFLDAGDALPPRALANWTARLRKAGADMGFARFIMAPDAPHTGLHDRPALQGREDSATGFAPRPGDTVYIHAHPSAKIWDRSFVQASGIRFAPLPLSSWDFLLRAGEQAGRILYLPGPAPKLASRPATRAFWLEPVPPADLARAVEQMAQGLPDGAAARLLVRALWEKINFAAFKDPAARAAYDADAAAAFAQYNAVDVVPDAYVGQRVRSLLNIPDPGHS